MLIIFDFTVQSSWIKQTSWVHIEATHHWISFHDKFQTNNDTKQRKRTLQSSLMSEQASPREFARLAREQERGMKGEVGGGGGEEGNSYFPLHLHLRSFISFALATTFEQ